MHSSTLLRISRPVCPSRLRGVLHACDNRPPATTGDPVADAARKARAEQKTAPKPKRVSTPTTTSLPLRLRLPPATTDATKKPRDNRKRMTSQVKRNSTLRTIRNRKLTGTSVPPNCSTKLAASEQELDVLPA